MDLATDALVAAQSGDLATLTAALDADPALASRVYPPGEYTLLHIAAKAGSVEAIDLLLARGAPTRVWPARTFHPDTPFVGEGAFTPLVQALSAGRWDAAERLAAADRFPDGLWVAVGLGRRDLAEAHFDEIGFLRETAGDPGRCQTPQQILDDAFVMACFRRDEAMALWLLEHGAAISGRDHAGVTGLHHAVCGDVALVRTLVGHGADAAVRDLHRGGTPLGWAIAWGEEAAVEVLLRHARLDVLDAISLGDAGLVAAILSREPQQTRGPTGQDEPLRLAARAGHLPIVDLLLQLGADAAAGAVPGGRGLLAASAIDWAREGGHRDIAERLQEAIGAAGDAASSDLPQG